MSNPSGPVSNFTIDLPGEEVKVQLEQQTATADPITAAPASSVQAPTFSNVTFPDPNAFSISNDTSTSPNQAGLPYGQNNLPYGQGSLSYEQSSLPYGDNPYLSVAGAGSRMEGAGNATYKTPAIPEYDDFFPVLPGKLELAVKILLMFLNSFVCLMFFCLVIGYGSSFSASYPMFFICFFSFIWYAFYIVVPLKIRNVQNFLLKHLPIMTSKWFMIFSPFIFMFTVVYSFYGGPFTAANSFRILGWIVQIVLMIVSLLYKFKFNKTAYASAPPQVNHYESAEDNHY